MADNINFRVSIDLHPGSIVSIDGYEETTTIYAAPARSALESAYNFIGAINKVRAAALADPTMTPDAAILKTDDYAGKKFASDIKLFVTTIANLGRSIASIENELAAPVKAKALDVNQMDSAAGSTSPSRLTLPTPCTSRCGALL